MPPSTKLHGDGASSLGHIQCWEIVHRREEATEGIAQAIARISEAVAVKVGLAGIRDARTVIDAIEHSIPVIVV